MYFINLCKLYVNWACYIMSFGRLQVWCFYGLWISVSYSKFVKEDKPAALLYRYNQPWFCAVLLKLHMPIYLLNLLTSWCRVLLELLTGLQLVKKFPAFHGTWRFMTALTSVRHLTLLGQPNPVHIPNPTSWRSILISTHLRPVVSFPPVSPPRPYTPPSPHPYIPHAQPISFFSILSPTQHANLHPS